MTDSVEILAHISAPSSAKDDGNYRAHAEAYLAFEPVSRTRIYPAAAAADDNEAQITHGAHDDTEIDRSPRWTAGEIDRAIGMSFEDSLGSSEDILEGLMLPPTTGSFAGNPRPRSPLVDYPPGRHGRVPSDPDPTEQMGNDTSDNPFYEHLVTPLPSHHWPSVQNLSSSFETPPSEVPDSQPPPTPSWNVEVNNSPEMRWAPDVQVTESPSPAHPVSKRLRLSQSPGYIPSSMPEEIILSPTRGRELASQPQEGPVDNDTSVAPITTLPSLPMEINPPPPVPSSTATFTTHITPTLHMLTEQLKLPRVFKPRNQARPLRTLERGYWFLRLSLVNYVGEHVGKGTPRNSMQSSMEDRGKSDDTSHPWPVELFLRFWDFLSVIVGKEGRAGWGVWCICDSPPKDTATERDPLSQQAEQLDVRIYTWGEVAPHIYLLMYLASDRNVKKVRGVQWRDATEEPIIFMD
ncbi:hypothetical protein AJ80_05824 [Polytolypa hystricis UAMH7299]|uniref:Uncharacterized protein n=1 Tax=Polytolypa hystricis (strain UAMH7299) TaxID=1447883 RepID=A0A2B7XS97_POLH7|nr:hypothetical protein AJ80_05824 [Polytolypa hystricis UAMH7299]